MSDTRNKIYPLALIGVMSAVICVLSPFSIPIGPVPISLANLAIYLSAYLLGWKGGTASTLVYLLLGGMGVPVFSAFTAGLGKLVGPTGGYLLGFLPLALVSGLAMEKSRSAIVHFLGMAVGTLLCYALGTAWFCYSAGYTVAGALAVCVFPFIPGDLIKIALVLWLGPVLRRRLVKARVLE